MKQCTKCSETKELSLFYKDKAFKDGHRSQCKSCDNKRHRNSLSSRKWELRKKYDLTLSQYKTMLASQNTKCAICGALQFDLKYRLCVDHDHETGEVRQLLCKPCNLVIGNCKENVNILSKAIEYLRSYEKSE